MPKITIDQREIDVPPGTTVLDAAGQLGIAIPTLCHWEGCNASTSCLVCVVKINGSGRLVPSCATEAVEGMHVESETEEVRTARRTALELLLSDHLGDCVAPCYLACPAEMDIPLMLRRIAAGDVRGAIETVKQAIAIPAILGRICPAPCEKICRRRDRGGAIPIKLLKRFVADRDLHSDDPYCPPCLPDSGKTVAILGGGPSGLSAAYYLTQAGHRCTLIEENAQLGGRLWTETTSDLLPRNILTAEIAQITRLGIDVQLNTRIENRTAFDELCRRFDAVLIAAGSLAKEQVETFGVSVTAKGLATTGLSFQTDRPNVFAAGNAVRGKSMVIRSAADGKEAAVAIDQGLQGKPVIGPKRPFTTKIGRMSAEELAILAGESSISVRREPAEGLAEGYSSEQSVTESARCLHCDCRKLATCRLRKHASEYEADPHRFSGERRLFEQDARHAELVFEPGKCIDCGLCIQIARRAGEEIGFTFVGRGFNVRLAVPLNRSLQEALRKAASACVSACPTAALAWK